MQQSPVAYQLASHSRALDYVPDHSPRTTVLNAAFNQSREDLRSHDHGSFLKPHSCGKFFQIASPDLGSACGQAWGTPRGASRWQAQGPSRLHPCFSPGRLSQDPCPGPTWLLLARKVGVPSSRAPTSGPRASAMSLVVFVQGRKKEREAVMSRGQEHRVQSSKDFRVNTHILTTRTPPLLEKNLLELEFPPAGYFLSSRSLSRDLQRMDIKIWEVRLNCRFSVDNLSSFSGCFKQFFSSLTFFIFTIMYLPYIWVSLGVMI